MMPRTPSFPAVEFASIPYLNVPSRHRFAPSPARRVLARFIQAETDALIAGLAGYRDKLADFAKIEDKARGWVATYKQVAKLNQGASPPWDQIKALRQSVPQGGPDSLGTVENLLFRDWPVVQNEARKFCWAALQQVALSPKLRKSIEAGAKFWDKKTRLPKGNTYEESLVKRLELYVELVDKARKSENIFANVVKEGKAHSDEGETATKLKAGPFVLINTGGFPTELMVEKAKLCEEAADRMTRIGLGNVCYGEVLISNKLTAKATIAAFYIPSKDEMFVRADAAVNHDTVRTMCHELAHRFDHKFMKQRHRVQELYDTIKSTGRPPKPKPGVNFSDGERTYQIIEVGREGIMALESTGSGLRAWKFTPKQYQHLATPPNLRFVSGYAEKGGPGENFAEMVSFHAMGKLPTEQLELLKPLLA